MSIVKDINEVVKDISELHLHYRSVIICYIMVMPFWYFDIYYVGHDFFKESPVYIPIVLAFCLTTLTLGFQFYYSLMRHHTMYKKVSETDIDTYKNNAALKEVFIYTSVHSVLALSVFNLFTRFHGDTSLTWFICFFFFVLLCLQVFAYSSYRRMLYKAKKENSLTSEK